MYLAAIAIIMICIFGHADACYYNRAGVVYIIKQSILVGGGYLYKVGGSMDSANTRREKMQTGNPFHSQS